MLFTHLSEKFYNDYPSDQYPEMMLKENRPYTQVITEVNGLKFAVPLRSDISHRTDVLWTDKQAKHGLDFTKAVLILDDEYISDKRAYIRDKEHQHLLGKERRVKEKMEKCIGNYKKSKRKY
jgi:protein AbiQ